MTNACGLSLGCAQGQKERFSRRARDRAAPRRSEMHVWGGDFRPPCGNPHLNTCTSASLCQPRLERICFHSMVWRCIFFSVLLLLRVGAERGGGSGMIVVCLALFCGGRDPFWFPVGNGNWKSLCVGVREVLWDRSYRCLLGCRLLLLGSCSSYFFFSFFLSFFFSALI